jgi:hypothetical protein
MSRLLRMGLGPGHGIRVSSAFDPATLSLTGWWRASYSGSPWAPTASAGSSGSNGNLEEATNPPATGSAVNGYTPADFDGSNDLLTVPGGAILDTFYNTTAYSVVMLINVDSFTLTDPGATQPFNCPGGFGDVGGNGGPCGGVAGSGASGVFRFGHSDVTDFNSASVAISTATWTMVAATYNGTNVEVTKNAGSAATQAVGTVTGLASSSAAVGRNYLSAQFFDGKVLEIMAADTALSGANLTNIKSYFNSRYGLSL